MKDYYQILNINYNASPEKIKQQYKILAKTYHPDLHKNNKDFYINKMQELNEAYNILSDTNKKYSYDNMFFGMLENNSNIEKITTKDYNKEIKKLSIIFIILSIVAISIIIFGIYKINQTPENRLFTSNIDYIDFNMNKKDVESLLGPPINETKHLMIYDEYEIIIHLNKVSGWLNPKDVLYVGSQKQINLNKIDIGADIRDVIKKYGNPDTYAKELAIYDNVIFHLNNNKITKVQIIEYK